MINNTNIDELIAKVLCNEATEVEIMQLEEWRKANTSNEEYYRSSEKIFNISSTSVAGNEYNTDEAWQKVKQSIKKTGSNELKSIKRIPFFTPVVYRIAAMILFVAGLSFAAYKLYTPDQKQIAESIVTDEILQDVSLPDSSLVTVNKKSKLEYTYNNKTRSATLTGEAYFDLASDDRPFELKAGTLTITDIGTAFNVKAPENSDSVIVVVTDGEVNLKSKNNKSLSLTKGQQAVYYKSRDEFIMEVISDTNVLAYKTKIFVFENTRLEIIVDKLNEVYDSSIKLSDNVSNCRLTATFKNESIKNIIDIISETLNLEVEYSGEMVILKGESCE